MASWQIQQVLHARENEKHVLFVIVARHGGWWHFSCPKRHEFHPSGGKPAKGLKVIQT